MGPTGGLTSEAARQESGEFRNCVDHFGLRLRTITMWTYRRNVNRRALGAVVLLLTALVAFVAPRVLGDQIAGTATARQIQRPPIVGECVLDEPAANGGALGRLADLHYGSGDGPHYGEVVQVFAQYADFPGVQRSGPDPDPANCIPASNSYLAVDQVLPRYDRGDFRSVSFGAWRPVSVGAVGVIGPSIGQQLADQQWLACVTEGNSGAPFLGTVRGAFTGGNLPDSYTVCTDQLRGGHPVNCASPHATELFADTGVTAKLPSEADLTTSCSDLVRYLSGRANLLVGGQLHIQTAIASYGDTGRPTAGQSESAQAYCGVGAVGASMLTATLFGLRNRPLPLS